MVLLFMLFPVIAFSQQFNGIVAGSYSGVGKAMVNPALMTNSRYYAEINVFSGGFFIHNNYAYLSRDEYNAFDFIIPGFQYPMHEKEYGQGDRPAYTVENKRLKNFFLDGHVMGPSAMVEINDHAFALSTHFRSVNSMRHIPYDMANYFYYSLDYDPQHGMEYEHRDPIRFGSLSWSEINLSWAHTFYKYDRDRLSLGVTAKLLLGHAASYVYLEHMQYFVPDDDNIYVRDLTGEAAYALPVDYSSNEMSGSKIKGMGLGFDLGIAYTHTEKGHSGMKYRRPCQQNFEEYKYRVGLSLMDFGWIRFNDAARKYEFDGVNGYWEQVDTLKPYYDNLEFISTDISERFTGDPQGALSSNSFNMFLPATLGAQFDYHYVKNWYLSASLRIPLTFARNQVPAPYGMTISPRLETQDFELGMPVSLYDMKHPMLGAYMRFYNFTIGTENLAGFMQLTNHYGFNVYFSFRINFIKDRCKRKQPRFCTDDFRFRGS